MTKKDEKKKWFEYNIILFMINIVCLITGVIIVVPLCVLPFTVLAQFYALMKYFGE